MSITETPAPAPKKKAKRKPRKAQKRVAAAKPETAKAAPFAGMTEALCAAGCNAKGCVISGREYCAHPKKGGLQGVDMGNQEALKRLQQAKKQLGMDAVDKRFA